MKNLITLIAAIAIFGLLAFVPEENSKSKESKIVLHEDHGGVCPDCNGVGNRICTSCEGNRTVTIQYDCSGCYARGTVPCLSDNCNGSGYIDCSYQQCKNGILTGKCFLCDGKSPEEISKCNNCKGTGIESIKCIYCNEKGEICHTNCNCTGQLTCPTCNGQKLLSRQTSCGSCEGNGYKKCFRCKGTGQIE